MASPAVAPVARQVLAQLLKELKTGPLPNPPLAENDKDTLRRLASGGRPITADNLRKAMEWAWDAQYFSGDAGKERLARLHQFICEREGQVPEGIPALDADRAAWVAFFEKLGRGEDAPPPPPPDLELYFGHIQRRFGTLTDASVRLLAASDDKLPRLAQVFVSVDAEAEAEADPGLEGTQDERSGERRTPEGPDGLKGRRRGTGHEGRMPAARCLAEVDRLVLLGPPGSGKSTVLKHVCECLAGHAVDPGQKWLDGLSVEPEAKEDAGPLDAQLAAKEGGFRWPRPLSTRVPVFLELRAWVDFMIREKRHVSDAGSVTDLLDAVEHQLVAIGLRDEAQGVRRAMQRGLCIVCLDGLDEVPDDAFKRFVVATIHEAAKPSGLLGGNRFVVTCRTVTYQHESWRLDGFKAWRLLDLRPPQVTAFVQRFYEELRVCRGLEDTQSRATDLLDAVAQRPELGAMSGNPYLLTLMSQLHLRQRLPEGRAELFEEFVEELLIEMEEGKLRKPQAVSDGRDVAPSLQRQLAEVNRQMEALRRALSKLAWVAHSTRNPKPMLTGEQVRAELQTIPKAKDYTEAFRARWAIRVLETIEHRTGLLLGLGGDQYAFAFKLQEYLAALHFTDLNTFKHPEPELASLIADASGYWEEVVRLAAAHLGSGHAARATAVVSELVASVKKRSAPSPEAAARRLVVASDIVREAGLDEIGNGAQGELCMEEFQRVADAMARDAATPVKQRAQAAMARGWLGSLPVGIGARKPAPDAKPLPDLAWDGDGWADVIQPGPFVMGSDQADPVADDAEHPQFQCRILRHAFRLARYPVTVAQFAAFTAGGGYKDRSLWTQAGWKWLQGEGAAGPWNLRLEFRCPSHPQAGVSFHEAYAYARWVHLHREALGIPLDWEVRPPTEAEWERAARGTRGLTYPWQSHSKRKVGSLLNHNYEVGHTSAVDLFPDGRAGCGAAEMAGNVWEWCLTQWVDSYQGYPARATDAKQWNRWQELNASESGVVRVVRGGAWSFDPRYCRSAFRNWDHPTYRNADVGFRLAASPISGLWPL